MSKKNKLIDYIVTIVLVLFCIGSVIWKIQGYDEKKESKRPQWTEEYTEIDEKDAKDKIGDNCKNLSSALLNRKEEKLYLLMKDGEGYAVKDPQGSMLAYIELNDIYVQEASFREGASTWDTSRSSGSSLPDTILSLFFLIMIFATMGITIYTRNGGDIDDLMHPGKKKQEIPDVRFKDVEGIEELKTDIDRVVDNLKNPDKYRAMGAHLTKGIILYGPPGTGKTLIAKAIAGESGVPFFEMNGSDFVNKYVGVGAENVRKLYKKARANAPCIVFIDEIDSAASKRGGQIGEYNQTVNALLSELDGFSESKEVVTICATNRLELLDDAFKRSGRFDLKLAVGLPDKKSRLNILKIHAKNKKFSDDVNLESWAITTSGFSGADLATLLNESASLAAQRNRDCITEDEMNDSFRKIVMQGNKMAIIDPETKALVAWHESGHAVVSKLLTDDSVSSVTIIGSTSGAGGVTFRTPNENNVLKNREYLINTIKTMYGGRAAEEVYFKKNKGIENFSDKITVGASNDIREATKIIKDFLMAYGFGGPGCIDIRQFNGSDTMMLREAEKIADKAYKETVFLLEENYGTLSVMAEELLKKETLDEPEIDEIMKTRAIS
jgi:cell division protease FtsH